MAYVISMLNLKGGVAKTSTCIGLAGALNQYHDKNVLVIDCDPSVNLTEFFTKSDEEPFKSPTLLECVLGSAKAEDAIFPYTFCRAKPRNKNERGYFFKVKSDKVPEDMGVTKSVTVHLLPGNEEICSNQIPDPFSIRKMVQGLDDKYDIIILDLPPEVLPITALALFASNAVIVPLMPAEFAISGFNKIVRNVNEVRSMGHPLDILGVLFTVVAENEKVDQKTINAITEMELAQDVIFKARIPRATAAKKCMDEGMLPTVYERISKLSVNYVLLASEVIDRISKRTVKLSITRRL